MLRSLFCGLLLMLTLPAVDAADAPFQAHQLELDGHTYRYQVFLPRGWNANIAWPVVLFLHGSGERGDDNQAQLSQGLPPWLRQHPDFPAVVVIPQAPADTHWSGAQERAALAALEASVQAYHGDRQRLYLTGLSMGGYGAWQIAIDHPGLFAAAAIVCGALHHPTDSDDLAVQGIPAGDDPYRWVAQAIGPLPVWIFHGAVDDIVPPHDSQALAQALQQAGKEVRFSLYPGVNHGSWMRAYDEPLLWPWMFGHRRQGPAPVP